MMRSMRDLSPQLRQLQQDGYRLTKIRKAVLEVLGGRKQPLSVPEFLIELRKTGLPTHKTTLYRQLEFLEAERLIAGVDFGDGKKRYEAVSQNHHHHLVCVQCEEVRDIALPEDFHKEGERIAEEKHFRILRHSLEFFGLCAPCAEKRGIV